MRTHGVKITLNVRCESYSNKVTQRTTPKSATMLRDTKFHIFFNNTVNICNRIEAVIGAWIDVGNWWNRRERGRAEALRNISQSDVLDHRFYMNWSQFEPGSPRWEVGFLARGPFGSLRSRHKTVERNSWCLIFISRKANLELIRKLWAALRCSPICLTFHKSVFSRM